MKKKYQSHKSRLFALAVLSVFAAGCSSIPMKTANLIHSAKYKVSIGDLRGSIADLEKTLELDPTNLEASVTMAQVQYRLGNLKKAEEYARAAIRIAPTDFRAIGILGLLNLRKGAYTSGINRVAAALEIFNGIEPVGGNVPLEPEAILKNMKEELARHKEISPDQIQQLESAFWAKVEWYEFDEEYRKWHFYSFYDVRPDGGDSYPN